MKKRGDTTSAYLDRILEVPGGTFGRDAQIEINSNREVTIEGCRGVLEYGEDFIKVNTGRSVLKLIGRNLLIKQITAERLQVCGRLTGLEFDC